MTIQPLILYNTLTRQKEKFEPINPPFVGMYVCGPTVYSDVHLGNCRTFISFDMIYRYLLHLGYKVRYVRNITDAGHLEGDRDEGDDRSRQQNTDPTDRAECFGPRGLECCCHALPAKGPRSAPA